MLGNRIAALRKVRKMSQEELAELLYTSRQAISKWERGESYPDIDRLKDLATLFGVSIDYILDYDMASASVERFIERLDKASGKDEEDFSEEEIKIMVATNGTNYRLLVAIIQYLFRKWSFHKNSAIPDLILEYADKATMAYRPEYKEIASLTEIRKAIVWAYVGKGDNEAAKNYIREHNIPNLEYVLAICEFELGNIEEAFSIVSSSFVESILLIMNGNIVQARLLLKKGQIKEALELSCWSISFIRSIGKKADLFMDGVYMFTFAKAICERHLGLDYEDSMAFLLENKEKVTNVDNDSGDIKFYFGKQESFISSVKDIKSTLEKEVNVFLKGTEIEGDGLYMLDRLFGD